MHPGVADDFENRVAGGLRRRRNAASGEKKRRGKAFGSFAIRQEPN
jgi:hypothetical protein